MTPYSSKYLARKYIQSEFTLSEFSISSPLFYGYQSCSSSCYNFEYIQYNIYVDMRLSDMMCISKSIYAHSYATLLWTRNLGLRIYTYLNVSMQCLYNVIRLSEM